MPQLRELMPPPNKFVNRNQTGRQHKTHNSKDKSRLMVPGILSKETNNMETLDAVDRQQSNFT
jgi:hypothetical protein